MKFRDHAQVEEKKTSKTFFYGTDAKICDIYIPPGCIYLRSYIVLGWVNPSGGAI